jgi:hypothetical protein
MPNPSETPKIINYIEAVIAKWVSDVQQYMKATHKRQPIECGRAKEDIPMSKLQLRSRLGKFF